MSAILPSHPLNHAGVIRIALGEDASKALGAAGGPFFAIVTTADATVPADLRGRFILHIMPTTPERADDAFRVIRGEKAKARIHSKS